MARVQAFLVFTVSALLAGGAVAGTDEAPEWADVFQIFNTRCVNCHAAHGAAKGLRLDSYQAAIAGGLAGPVLLPGDPAGSEMVRRILGESVPRMPFLSTPLPQEEIDVILRWVESGLPETRP
ncbi:c-type cytochrome domain-containing protein [Oceanibium sediminis]|uniref:c-type cytochrome domain-containing protein n=1 Tax=Oceanibium sediminis TaxID=2026339 RepID=UPI001300A99F|nr:c-type cytochrome domain-containing protein [Oceanibium sediminis]